MLQNPLFSDMRSTRYKDQRLQYAIESSLVIWIAWSSGTELPTLWKGSEQEAALETAFLVYFEFETL